MPCFFSLRKDLAEQADLKLQQTGKWTFGFWVNWLGKRKKKKSKIEGREEVGAALQEAAALITYWLKWNGLDALKSYLGSFCKLSS